MSDTVQQIKDRLSIVDVVSQYVKLERAGSALRARCPFHAERTPSFFVSPERGTYHCFGCDVGGDIFSFVEQIEGLDFKGALKVLAEKAGVPLVYERPQERDSRDRLFELLETATIFYSSRLSDAALRYLAKRGINEKTVRAFRLGLADEAWNTLSDYLRAKRFSEKEIAEAGLIKKSERGTLTDRFRNRIIFPIADSAGRIVGFSGRIFSDTTNFPDLTYRQHFDAGARVERMAQTNNSFEPPKYLNSPETPLFHKSKILYGFDHAKQAIRKHNCAVLVEGQLDLLASHQAGWGNTVAVSGTAFTPEHATLIRRMTDNLIIALDADEAGIKAAGRAARAAIALGLNVKVAQLPTGLDPADFIFKEGSEAWRAAIRNAKDIITFLLDVLHAHTPKQDTFRRHVEAIVLPFIVDVKSPIAREQYIREVAGRLGVSEQAVTDALVALPHSREGSEIAPSQYAPTKNGPKMPTPSEGYGRTKQAFALLLWQEARHKPELDLKSYVQEFEKAIGADAFRILRSLPEKEQEAMRFSAEELYGKSRGLKREAGSLLGAITLDRLLGELKETTLSLKLAEAAEDKEKIRETMRHCKLLTTQIALLRK